MSITGLQAKKTTKMIKVTDALLVGHFVVDYYIDLWPIFAKGRKK
jgi:hypothetical protein